MRCETEFPHRLPADVTPQEPRRGVAADEVILETARGGGGTVRVWANGRAAVVGRSRAVPARGGRRPRAEDSRPDRATDLGGGTVLHYPGDLDVSMALPDGRQAIDSGPGGDAASSGVRRAEGLYSPNSLATDGSRNV